MLFSNLRLATMTEGGPYGLIEDGAVLVKDGRIAWTGARKEAPAAQSIDCGGRLLTPGLIDCHTHIVYGGNRAREFEQRLNGVSYAEIAKAGGGILSTVRATRAASEEELLKSASTRLESLLAEGVTTIEIKSGYGLDVETELKMLRVARALGKQHPVDVVTSYLGAHTFPAEYRDDHAAYVDLVCGKALPAVAQARLADAVDAFCEGIAFSVAETEKVFATAQKLGIPIKLHAEQLSNLGGAILAARYGALSVDHIEYLDEDGVVAIAQSGTVAVLLPGAFYYLKEKQHPPVAALRARKVPIAIATDLNPGSSPVHSLLATMNMACVLFGLTPEEALRGVTVNAARALGFKDRGRIAPGMKADLVLWNAERPGDLAYPLGFNPLAAVIRNGEIIRGKL
ncbi:imidazolonepropionase [Taklimakanibacter lacteus]|uniref:imidazolonepropionase n=1 Tax=Taklimakanibacter lacteus TaxID=2268456 RepID=UPI000E66A85B